MLERFLTSEQRRQKLLKKAPVGPLADYLSTPFVAPDKPLDQVEFLALDLEATGLDIKQDEILSVGYAVVRNMKVVLGESAHFLVRPTQTIPEQSAVLHGIMDDQSAQGLELAEAVKRILQALKGRVLLAHHGNIETGFINKACERLYDCGVVFPLVDTFAIEFKSLQHRGVTPRNSGLRLASLRAEYSLPRYPVHNALSDAVATAELFLAQVAHRSGNNPMKLKEVMMRR
jgi:DNA polymerase-3 subunit epsilon